MQSLGLEPPSSHADRAGDPQYGERKTIENDNKASFSEIIQENEAAVLIPGESFDGSLDDVTLSSSVQTEEGPQIGTYRGAPLKAKSYRFAPHPNEKVQLSYRGVKYSR